MQPPMRRQAMPTETPNAVRERVARDPTTCFKLFSLLPVAEHKSGDVRDLTGESGNNMTPSQRRPRPACNAMGRYGQRQEAPAHKYKCPRRPATNRNYARPSVASSLKAAASRAETSGKSGSE